MEPILHWALAFVAVAAPIAGGLVVRKRFLSTRPQLGAAVVVAAAGLGVAITVAALHALDARGQDRRFDGVFDGLCRSPRAGDETAQAFHELACSPDTRVADLRGASEYQGVWVHLATRNDKLSVFAPRPDAIPAVPNGKAYHLWLLDRAGTPVEHTRLDRTMSTLIIKRPELAKAVKAVITVDVPTATQPNATIIVQGELAPL